ncbi:uroporphyrinogen-III C-methyltransferase [Clostridium sp.]|uniref:uroporphyrinogen-III C-methyltransferase n=1 Tax=Clostridium sp. TaxID=1506 RepID=UPI003464178B
MSKVYIIGAGPGDEDLLTLKAKKSLEKCTAVLYDRLIGGNILKHLNKDCEIYYCGKEPGCHYKTQEEINESLVRLSKKGHIVGRIKGGDPYVFGRGGEEVLDLIKENIEFEVIPGVTSAIGALSYAGIPVTQRGVSQSFHVITGMTSVSSKVNYEALAKLSGTLIFLMGVENIKDISSNLIKYGKSQDTPCGIVRRGTTSKQKTVITTLKDAENKIKEEGLTSPCIIVVGEVVNFRESLNWFEKKELFGLNLCITRSREQAKSLSSRVKDLGGEVTEIPSLEIRERESSIDPYLNNIQHYDHIILTSVNGVNVFFDYLINKNFDIRNIKADFSVIGNATFEALRKRGIIAKTKGEEFTQEGLLEALKGKIQENHKVFIPCAKNSRRLLEEELKNLCRSVTVCHSYETVIPPLLNERAFDDVDVVLYTSPSTVKNMINMVGKDKLKKKLSLAIGPITEKELEKEDLSGIMCDRYFEDGIIEKLLELRGNKQC